MMALSLSSSTNLYTLEENNLSVSDFQVNSGALPRSISSMKCRSNRESYLMRLLPPTTCIFTASSVMAVTVPFPLMTMRLSA